VYYAYDFDVPDHAPGLPDTPANARAKLGPLGDYAEAIHATRPNHEVAGYGGYWAVSRLLDAGLIRKAFQTLAWSGTTKDAPLPSPNAIKLQVNGRWYLYDKRAALRQELAQILGADIDTFTGVHTGHGDDFGQWPRPKAPAQPVYWHLADGTESFADIGARRNANAENLLLLSARHWSPAQQQEVGLLLAQLANPEAVAVFTAMILPAGFPYATIHP
jgi:hypothetical protein